MTTITVLNKPQAAFFTHPSKATRAIRAAEHPDCDFTNVDMPHALGLSQACLQTLLALPGLLSKSVRAPFVISRLALVKAEPSGLVQSHCGLHCSGASEAGLDL